MCLSDLRWSKKCLSDLGWLKMCLSDLRWLKRCLSDLKNAPKYAILKWKKKKIDVTWGCQESQWEANCISQPESPWWVKKVSCMSSNRPLRNCHGVLKEHLIRHVLRGQNGRSIEVARNIQVTSSLQVDVLFIIGSWV